MKKLFFLSAMIGLMAATAAADEIYSCNTVGVQRVSATTDKLNVPIPFVAIGGGDITLADTLYADNIALADYAMVSLNSDGKYNQWMWFGSFVEGGWYPSTQNDVTPPAASSQVLPRGSGVVVNHGNSKANPVYVMGQYDPDTPMTSVVNKGKRSFLVNPTQSNFDIESKIVGTSILDEWDAIWIVRQGQTYVYNYSYFGNAEGCHWFYRDLNNKQVFDKPVIAPGEGFWYNCGPILDKTIVW